MDARLERLEDGFAVLTGDVVLVDGIGDRFLAETLVLLARQGGKALARELDRLAEAASEDYGWEQGLLDLGVMAA